MSGSGSRPSGSPDPSDQSVPSGRSDRSSEPPRARLRPSGGYRDLRSFQTTTRIYDGTVAFCSRFVDSRSRTVDQMVQAARSGRQNIAEGSRAAATSSQTELRLVNVARASLDELLLDYEDFLRQRKLPQWAPNSPEASAVRAVPARLRQDPPDQSHRSDPSDSSASAAAAYAPWLDHADPAIVANTLICLIHQANYLLDRQVSALERDFIHEGGYSEQLAAARLAQRRAPVPAPKPRPDQSDRSDPSDFPGPSDLPSARPKPAAPTCTRCSHPMVRRTARQGAQAGKQFWGCSAYPACKATLPIT